MKRLIPSYVVLVICTVLFGCNCQRMPGFEPQLVNNKKWILTSMNGQQMHNAKVTMELHPATATEGRIRGAAQCNRYFGRYSIKNNKIYFTQMAGSLAACPPPYMKQEYEYLTTLPMLENTIINENKLILSSSNSEYKLTFVSESASITGEITASKGAFVAGSEIVVQLQDSAIPDDPSGIIGTDVITINKKTNSVNYTVHYAPELVDPHRQYELMAQVFLNGKIEYTSVLKPNVVLESPANFN